MATLGSSNKISKLINLKVFVSLVVGLAIRTAMSAVAYLIRSKVEILKSFESGNIVTYSTSLSAGGDVYSTADVELAPGETVAVPTGLFLRRVRVCLLDRILGRLFEVQVRPRSGLALKHSITVANAPGTIDIDYKQEIKVLLTNHGTKPWSSKKGERVAQLVLSPVYRLSGDVEVSSEKRVGGFGSTGK